MVFTVHVWYNDVESVRSLKEPTVIQHSQHTPRTSFDADILKLSEEPFCTYSIVPSYVKDVLALNGLLAILKDDGLSVGFILARETDDGGIYLDVICSKEGTGGAFLEFFIAMCEDQGARYVELSSLINVLAFYPRYGFEHRKSCVSGEGAEIAMSAELANHIKKGVKEGQLKKYTDYYADPHILRYVMELHARGYTQTVDPPVCKKRSLSGARYRQYHCARDGFAMRKCFGIPSTSARTLVPFEAYNSATLRTKTARTKIISTVSKPLISKSEIAALLNVPVTAIRSVRTTRRNKSPNAKKTLTLKRRV